MNNLCNDCVLVLGTDNRCPPSLSFMSCVTLHVVVFWGLSETYIESIEIQCLAGASVFSNCKRKFIWKVTEVEWTVEEMGSGEKLQRQKHGSLERRREKGKGTYCAWGRRLGQKGVGMLPRGREPTAVLNCYYYRGWLLAIWRLQLPLFPILSLAFLNLPSACSLEIHNRVLYSAYNRFEMKASQLGFVFQPQTVK